ncbi:MAG: cytotoxic necrotizing factor Rho-activating domain-containing protein [Lachnospiraceae bacterium]|nr:cytotoxic necrotizing factor Rho-activating domain-containing protein [Lachnospiraceae bacterium]
MPGIDITDAVRYADLRCNEVISAWNQSYMVGYSNTTDQLSSPKGLFLNRKSREVTEQKLEHCCFIEGKNLNLSNVVYQDNSCALNYYCINNPREAGANGIRMAYGNKRFFIASGELTGCGFAVLVKENDLYIIHAGAATATTDTAAIRRGYINRDIYCMARRLSDSKFDTRSVEGAISCNELYSSLKDEGFYGFLILQGDQTALSTETQIWTFQYYSGKKNGTNTNRMADVICALNEQGEMMISQRILEQDFTGIKEVAGGQLQVALFL